LGEHSACSKHASTSKNATRKKPKKKSITRFLSHLNINENKKGKGTGGKRKGMAKRV
jgi:hypothetical protein